MDLAGKVVLITGGAGGLGQSVARRAAAGGASVALNFRSNRVGAEQCVRDLRAQGHRAASFEADVSDWSQAHALVAEVRDWVGPVDILVNNAGVTRAIPAARVDLVTRDDWAAVLDVNLLAAFACSQAMAAQAGSPGGSILNVASDSAFSGLGSSIPYVVSKAALVSLTTALAQALAPRIRVNAVAPSWMGTPWLERYLPSDEVAAIRSHGMLEPDAVATVALALAIDDTRSGETVVIQPPAMRVEPADGTSPARSSRPSRHSNQPA